MKIAHLTTVHPRYDTRIFQRMCCSLAEAGHTVTLYVADGLGNELIKGVQIVDIGKPQNRVVRACLTTAQMWLKASQSDHQILHFHDPELIAGALLARLGRPIIIYDIHEYYREHLKQTASLPAFLSALLALLYGVAERSASACLHACIVVSPHMLHVLPLRNAIIIENHVRSEEFYPDSTPLSARPLVVCYVGVLSKERLVESMLEAVAKVGARLALAGRWYPASYRDQLTPRPSWQIVDEWGVVDRRQIQHIFDHSRAGLLILDLHGDEEHASSNKLFEYMAAGLPVIASDLAFTREVIDRHHCGLLVSPPTDIAALAAAISWILEHPDEAEQMGRAGRRAVEQHYSWDRTQARLLNLYSDLLNKTGSRF
ncbi:MAG: glycosyltransferase [Cyanobacteriota bacterium]|jgi:glycosyltransferase involved in cell wall biosynthesis